jgi:hypothetical protein
MKPDAVVRAERVLGLDAESWEPVASRGYSRNEHWTIACTDGTRAFVKLASIDPSPRWLREEVEVYAKLKGPFMPAFLGWEDGDEPLLVLEDVGGRCPPPWQSGDVELVLDVLHELAQVTADLPRLDEIELPGWHDVARDPAPFLSLGLVTREWLDVALPRLLAATDAVSLRGGSVVHCDVRSDNLTLQEGRAVLFDWNHARLGNPAFDVAFWLPSLTLEGGPSPLGLSPEADPLAAAVSGFFAAHAGSPPPAGTPRVRSFQLAQLEVALPWACAVADLPLK